LLTDEECRRDRSWARLNQVETMMNQMSAIIESDDHGVLHLTVPALRPRCRMRVEVTWTPAVETLEEKRAALEALAGALADDPLERPEPGVFEIREPLP
jgi:hypothetical protein